MRRRFVSLLFVGSCLVAAGAVSTKFGLLRVFATPAGVQSAADAQVIYTINEIHPLPGDNHVQVAGLNDAGIVIGVSFSSPTQSPNITTIRHPFTYHVGIETPLKTNADCQSAYPIAINNHGIVVGQNVNSTPVGSRPVVWDGAHVRVLTPTDTRTRVSACSINSAGEIFGLASSPGRPVHPVVLSGHTVTHLPIPAALAMGVPTSVATDGKDMATGIFMCGTVGYTANWKLRSDTWRCVSVCRTKRSRSYMAMIDNLNLVLSKSGITLNRIIADNENLILAQGRRADGELATFAITPNRQRVAMSPREMAMHLRSSLCPAR